MESTGETAEWVTEWTHAMRAADRACRQETGHPLAASYQSLCFTMALLERYGTTIDWSAVVESLGANRACR